MTTLKYFFPSWFIAVDMKIRLESFPVQFCLQTPRRVSHTSPLFLAIAHSDIEGVRELLLSHRASVNDVDPHGRGVLHYAGDGLIYYSYKRVTKMLELLVGAGAHTEWEEDEFQRYVVCPNYTTPLMV
ncbi:hypothetical protein PHLCEN_2v8024 [Hermanssonia centrifuga]|uniref:Uncharacterized protein n=1 Tax=Hermanssonia centrifuga TaxID=98765 RepID=A0A2R6NUX0_9APHY|nr:hypothetical protein PHLCEN_2v8024 [Hermanssonia centrifuga]